MPGPTPVDTVREAWSRFGRAGMEGALALAHDDVEIVPHDAGGQVFRGREAVLDEDRRRRREGIKVEAVAHGFEDLDDCVVVVGRVRVLSRGGHYDMPMCWQVEVEAGRIARVRAERSLTTARADCAATR